MQISLRSATGSNTARGAFIRHITSESVRARSASNHLLRPSRPHPVSPDP